MNAAPLSMDDDVARLRRLATDARDSYRAHVETSQEEMTQKRREFRSRFLPHEQETLDRLQAPTTVPSGNDTAPTDAPLPPRQEDSMKEQPATAPDPTPEQEETPADEVAEDLSDERPDEEAPDGEGEATKRRFSLRSLFDLRPRFR